MIACSQHPASNSYSMPRRLLLGVMCRVLSHTYIAPWARQLLAGKYVMILLLLMMMMMMTGQLVSMQPTGSKLFVFWIIAEALQRSQCAITFLQRTSETVSGNEVELKNSYINQAWNPQNLYMTYSPIISPA